MRIITLTNQKGGVGKTTTTVNLAAALAEMGKKVMLIDLDPQAHLTTFLGLTPDAVQGSAYDVLTQKASLSEALIPVRETISVLASEINLAAAEQELVSVVGRETILREALREQEGQWEYIFIDCPPSLGLLTLNALVATREVFIPLQAHFLSLQGLSQLIESLLLVHKRVNPALKVSGLIFCMFDSRTTLSGEIFSEIERFFAEQRSHDCPWRDIRIFETRIRQNVKLAESPSYGQTIFEYEPHCNGAYDYMALAKEVEGMTSVSDGEGGQTVPYGTQRVIEHESPAAEEEQVSDKQEVMENNDHEDSGVEPSEGALDRQENSGAKGTEPSEGGDGHNREDRIRISE